MTTMLTTPAESAALATAPTLRAADESRVAEAVEDALAPHTRRAYDSAWRRYEVWLRGAGYAGCDEFDAAVVAAHLVALSDAGLSPSSVTQARAAILHRAGPRAERLRVHEGLRRATRGLRRTGLRSHRPTQARALTAAEVRAVIRAIPDSLVGARDRAILLLGLALGVRASNLGALLDEDVSAVEGGLDVVVRSSKTSDLPVTLAVPRLEEGASHLCAVRALEEWLRLRNIASPTPLSEGGADSSGQLNGEDMGAAEGDADSSRQGAQTAKTSRPLFSGIRRGGWSITDRALSVEAITAVIVNACGRGNVAITGISSHSLRATYATLGLESGVSEAALMRDRWSSGAVFRGYDRSTRWSQPAAAYLGSLA